MRKKFVQDLLVVENTALNSTNFLIKLKASEVLPDFSPGQFVNIDIKNSTEIFLRRPFSVFEFDKIQNTISLIVKILGRGSKTLTEIAVGEQLSVVFPLGNGFTNPDKNDRILLIGGGSGVAPMLFLSKVSGLLKNKVDILLGAKTVEDHVNVDDYKEYGQLYFQQKMAH